MNQAVAVEPEKVRFSREVEPTRVITVRVPASVHTLLQREAHEHFTSMNRWCVAKLLSEFPSTDADEELLGKMKGALRPQAVRCDS